MRTRRSIRDEALEVVLRGMTPEGRDDLAPLAGLVAEMRRAGQEGRAPQPGAELAAFMAAPPMTATGELWETVTGNSHEPAVQVAGLPKWRETARRRKARMLSGLSGFLATLTGKVVLGTAVAAASVGGLHASDMVDIPGLPDPGRPAVESQDEAGAQNGDELPSEAVEGQQTAEEKRSAAEAYTEAVREWTGCVSENAAGQGDETTRTTGEFDPREGCGARPAPENFGLTTVPSQADEGQQHGDEGGENVGGTPGEENVPDDPASQADEPTGNVGGTPGEENVPDDPASQADEPTDNAGSRRP